MIKVWYDQAWEDYLYWITQDKKTIKKINNLLKAIDRGDEARIGKAEILKHKDGFWCSMRIDGENRLVYRVKDNKIEIAQCKGHYEK